MSLTRVDGRTYALAVSSVPEHDNKFIELRSAGSFYYARQYVFDEQGRLVAFHDDNEGGGQRWIDLSLLTDEAKRQEFIV